MSKHFLEKYIKNTLLRYAMYIGNSKDTIILLLLLSYVPILTKKTNQKKKKKR